MIGWYDLLSGAIGAIVTGVVGYFGIVRKVKADETSIALSAWKELLLPLQEELRQAKEEIKQLRTALEIAEARHEKDRDRLIRRIKELQDQITLQAIVKK